jgi:hypothetical protein
METFSITSGTGETWTLVSASNFFDPGTSTDGNPVPYVFPAPIPEGPMNNYSIDGIRVEGAPWSIVVNNGVMDIPFNSTYTCSYPDTMIYGDLGNCIGTFDNYYIDIPDANLVSVQWSLPGGGGSIRSADDEKSVEILWGATPGVYQLSVDVDVFTIGGPMSSDRCMFTTTVDVEVVSEPIISLACNNELNLSLSGLCELEVTPSMFLEGMELPESSYDVIIRDIEADTIIGGRMLNNDYVGKLLEVKIQHECSFNSCWGFLLVEDKAAPPLLCGPDVTIDCDMLQDPSVTGFPVPPTAIVTPIDNDTYLVENYDPCGDATLTYRDERTEGLCAGPYSAVITRTWYITDDNGNINSCSSVINVNRALFEDIVFPENWDDATGPNPSLEACGGWEMTEKGTPAPSVTGSPTGVDCLNASVEFEDIVIEKCDESNIDKTFKVLRRWTVVDHCTSRDSVHVQYISVLDRTDPVVTVPAEIIVNTTLHSCAAQIHVPAPEVEECSKWDYAVSYRLKDGDGNPIGNPIIDDIWWTGDHYVIENIPADEEEIWVIYTVYDICGNVTEEVSEIVIIDNEEPVPVCDQYSYVALNEEGIAWVGTSTFDDGSWDNCGIALMEVRRMESSACGEVSAWSSKVKFCCADIGNTVMVALRVTDYAGNSNSCMVEVQVQDNHNPEWIFCPADQNVDCDIALGDYTQFGMATARDNCGAVVTVTNRPILNTCGLGRIERTFTAVDDAGNSISKTQMVYVVNQDLLNENHIDWPDDIVLPNGCANGGILPENLPVGFNYPDLNETSCSNALYDYEDLEFQYVEGACIKVIRKWTVIDWCQFDPFYPERGKFYHNQIIKVLNSEPPQIVEGCSGVQNVEQIDGCDVIVTLKARAEDDCTAPSDLIWRYELDINNDGITDKTGTDNDATSIISYGEHKITWYVTDECDNQSTCSNVFVITDQKKPTPVCLQDIVTVVMDRVGSVTIWASDFDKGSYDNCGYNTNVDISFSEDISDTFRTFTCEDLNGKIRDTFEIRMYVTDPYGNNEFCTTTIIIQDNKNTCGNEVEPEETFSKVAGAIYSETDEMISDVEVRLMSDAPEFPKHFMTEDNGAYAFNDLTTYKDYMIEPGKVDEYLNGISTLDIVLIQRHILGLQQLDSPYKIIAADINNSSSVSASDIIQLRKLILGIYTDLPNNESWRFVSKAFDFDDVERPFPFEEQITLSQLDEDIEQADFVAIKVGDVNGTASSSRARSNSSRSSLPIEYTYTQSDQYHYYTFKITEEINLTGVQLSLSIDGLNASDVEVIGAGLPLDESNYSLFRGGLSVSFSEGIGNRILGDLFTLKIRSPKLGGEQIALSNALDAEIYVLEGTEHVTFPIHLEGTASGGELILLQNTPNPFNETTGISFILPQDGQVDLRILDLTGKLLRTYSNYFYKGKNTINIQASDIEAQGILYYQIETQHHSLTKKMILIK